MGAVGTGNRVSPCALPNRFKIKLIRDVLALDVTVIVSDIDTAWTKNPLPYFAQYPEADILTSTDQLSPTVKDDSLELFPNAGSAFNIGIMLFRPNSKKFVGERHGERGRHSRGSAGHGCSI